MTNPFQKFGFHNLDFNSIKSKQTCNLSETAQTLQCSRESKYEFQLLIQNLIRKVILKFFG